MAVRPPAHPRRGLRRVAGQPSAGPPRPAGRPLEQRPEPAGLGKVAAHRAAAGDVEPRPAAPARGRGAAMALGCRRRRPPRSWRQAADLAARATPRRRSATGRPRRGAGRERSMRESPRWDRRTGRPGHWSDASVERRAAPTRRADSVEGRPRPAVRRRVLGCRPRPSRPSPSTAVRAQRRRRAQRFELGPPRGTVVDEDRRACAERRGRARAPPRG